MNKKERSGIEEATNTELKNIISAMENVPRKDFGQYVEDLLAGTNEDEDGPTGEAEFERLFSEDEFVSMYPEKLDRNKANYFNYQMNRLKDALKSYSDNLTGSRPTDDDIKVINEILDKRVPYFEDEDMPLTTLGDFIDYIAEAEISEDENVNAMFANLNKTITGIKNMCKS